MAVELWPSVLAFSAGQFRQRLQRARRLSTRIHLDIMDGRFVTTKSVSPRTLERAAYPKHLSIHVMVQQPERYWQLFSRLRPEYVFLPAEIGERIIPTIAFLRSLGIRVGVALNPKTPLSRLSRVAHMADQFLILAVDPGHYHGRYHRQMLSRVSQLHKRYPRKTITVDGHMDEETIPAYIAAGARSIVVGSAVMLQPQPLIVWKRLQKLCRR